MIVQDHQIHATVEKIVVGVQKMIDVSLIVLPLVKSVQKYASEDHVLFLKILVQLNMTHD
jgi:hypothetical protein